MRSFIVRLWHPLDLADPARGLRGTVVHVGSGRSAVFTDAATLLAFLQQEQEALRGAVDTGSDHPKE